MMKMALIVVAIFGFFACGTLVSANQQKHCVEFLKIMRDDTVKSLKSGDAENQLFVTCNWVPDEYQDFCYDFMKTHGSEILQTVADGHLPTICSVINQILSVDVDGNDGDDALSGGDEVVFNGEMESAGDPVEGEIVGGIGCILCENVIKFVKAFLSDTKHKASMLKMAENLCNYVPFIRSTCTNLLHQYGPLALRLIPHFLKPELCKTFGLCPRSLRMEEASEDMCKMCRFGVGVVQDTINDPAIHLRLHLLVQALCSEIQADPQTCDKAATYFSKRLPEAISFVKQTDFLNGLCENTHVCNADEGDEAVFEDDQN